MSKFFKKTLSVVLVILMVAGTMPMAFAEETSAVAYDGDPIVVVRGIDFAGLVKADGSKAISFKATDIFNLIANIGLYKMRGDKNAEINAITDFGCALFSDVMRDKEGVPANPEVTIPKFLTSADKIDLSGDQWADTAVGLFRSIAKKYGGENTYLYTFDWRLSPDELADDLKSFLDLVKKETGASKLDIAACSMGGMITTSYISKYGADDFDTVVFLSSAHNGGHIVGSAFSGDLVIDSKALGNFLIEKTKGNVGVNLLVRVLSGIGMVKVITNYVNKIITNNKELLYDNFLRECFATAYGLWALIPDEKFDESVDFFFNDDKAEYTTALSEIAKVREFVFNTDNIIADLHASGVKVSFVSHYNALQLPIYSKYTCHGDGVLESDRTSGYATFANYGKTLSDAEIAGVDAQYISPNKVVNASTCLYPETTWFVKNAKHVGCKDNSDHTEFAIWLLTRDVQPTVHTDASYPRFLNVDANENFIGF